MAQIALNYSAAQINAAIAKINSLVSVIEGNIVQLYDNSTAIYPRTKAEAVFFDNDTSKTLDQQFSQSKQNILDINKVSSQNLAAISSVKNVLTPDSIISGKFLGYDGSIHDNSNYSYHIYSIEENKQYAFSGGFSSGTSGIPFICWFDSLGNFLSSDYHRAPGGIDIHYTKEGVIVPNGAAYAYMNVQNSLSSESSYMEIERIDSTTTLRSRGVLPSCDLNDVRTAGIWLLTDSNTYQNTPTNDIGFLRVSTTDGLWICQEYILFTGLGYYKRRGNVNTGVFESWYRMDKGGLDDTIENICIRAGLTPARISSRTILIPSSTISGKFINPDGSEGTNASFSYKIYQINSSKIYAFSGRLSNAGIPFIVYFDSNDNFISYEFPTGSTIDNKDWNFQLAYPPKNAAYAKQNIQNSVSEEFEFYELTLLDLYIDALVSKGALPSGNLDDYRDNGFYLLGSPNIYQNAPNNAQYGFLRIQRAASNSQWSIQEYWDLSGTEYYIRRGNDSSYSSWIKVGDLTQVNSKVNYLSNLLNTNTKQEILINDSIEIGHLVVDNGVIRDFSSSFAYRVFSVSPGDCLICETHATENISFWLFNWFDENGVYISQQEPIIGVFDGKKMAIVPAGAAYVYINQQNSYPAVLSKAVDFISFKGVEEVPDILNAVSNVNQLIADSTINGKFINSDGTEGTNANFSYKTYSVSGGKFYLFSGQFGNAGIKYIHWYDANGDWIVGSEQSGPETSYSNVLIQAPDNAAYAKQNIQNSLLATYDFKELTNKIFSRDLKAEIEALEIKAGPTKIVINSLGEPVSTVWGNAIATDRFHIRAKYNSEKDVLIRHYYNGNSLISFLDTYVGPKSLSDAELATNDYLVSTHSDSTAPLFKVTEYWHLFAQHGYPAPFIDNPGLTSADIGAIWRDNVSIDDGGGNSHYRHYVIGRVTTARVWLLPVIYQKNGHDVRDWKNTVYSPAITTLIHESGGSYTSQITVSGYSQDQLRPIMTGSNRKFVVDGVEITSPGTYFGKEIKISESAIGYDPASIDNEDWFANTGDNVNPSGGDPMCKFTFSYNYMGAQCCVNTTIQFLKEIQCEGYGAIQQQFFYDNGDYKAMFMIPKAARQNNVDLDKPFNSPANTSHAYDFYRTAQYLKDINNPVDRQIGYLYDPNINKYLVGMAAGLSLVSGDTITSKRIINCIEGNNASNYRILTFSPSNINKFYVMAINTAKYEDGFFPVGLFKEINYYVSYFDPAENVGQVYWYKDGSKFVIYCHCQSQESILGIKVPEYMEGLKLSIVEKTDDAELLTDTIQNGKFFVNYNSNDANYIVLIAQ